jgi:hypothetical protein
MTLKRAVSNEESLCLIIGMHDADTSFSTGWEPLNGRFSHLMAFSSGLATLFPGTAVVESYFSVLKYEKNSCRTSLLDLTLEGIMHSKQYDALF